MHFMAKICDNSHTSFSTLSLYLSYPQKRALLTMPSFEMSW